ncbi:hypothetical protein RCL1_004244 [Eukaryota sp. TZLM3-RCL]
MFIVHNPKNYYLFPNIFHLVFLTLILFLILFFLVLLPINFPRGFTNLGQSCYVSCILQAFFNLPQFVSYFLSDLHPSSHCPLSKDPCILCEIDTLIQAKFSPLGDLSAPIIPSSFLFSSWTFIPSLAGHAQQDAHEYFVQLINVVHELIVGNCHVFESCSCFIHQLFNGRLNSKIYCSKCGQEVSSNFEPFCDLSLSLPVSSTPINLFDCFLNFFSSTVISSDSSLTCSSCRNNQLFVKRDSISVLPQVLVLQILRFSFNKNGSVAKNQSNLIVSNDLSCDGTMYKLSSVVCHRGSDVNTGHYVTFFRQGNDWFLSNDDCVSVVDFDSIHSEHSYLLFYNKIS